MSQRPYLARVAFLVLALAPSAALGVQFVVDSTEDAVDAAIDGVCADATGLCTLRAALQEANATPEEDTINLQDGVHTLKLQGPEEDFAATGDLDVRADLTLRGDGVGETILKGKKDRVIEVFPGTTVVIRDLTITKGKVGPKGGIGDEFNGGGIRNDGTLTLLAVELLKNKASDDGGGIANLGGTLTLQDVSLIRNKSGDDAGGLDNDDGFVQLHNVTFAKNKAVDEGGALESEQSKGEVAGLNVTLSGNKAFVGGAVNVEQGGSVELVNATVAKNKAKAKGQGGGLNNEDGSISLTNTVVDSNKKQNCNGAIDSSGGGNVENGATCGFGGGGNLEGVAAGLFGLADNGGPTMTHALRPESPAIDFGVDSECSPTDQRGEPRFDGGVGTSLCDSGAYEFRPPGIGIDG